MFFSANLGKDNFDIKNYHGYMQIEFNLFKFTSFISISTHKSPCLYVQYQQ